MRIPTPGSREGRPGRQGTAGGQVRLSGEHSDYVWATPAGIPGMDLSDQLRSFVLPHAASVET